MKNPGGSVDVFFGLAVWGSVRKKMGQSLGDKTMQRNCKKKLKKKIRPNTKKVPQERGSFQNEKKCPQCMLNARGEMKK